MKRLYSTCKILSTAVLFLAVSCVSSDNTDPLPVKQVTGFDISDVRLLEGPFRTAQKLNEKYLLSIDPDRMLHMFKVTSGLQSSSQAYGGWESEDGELRGHTIGHYLSALGKMYNASGNEEFKNRGVFVVEELSKCQDAFGKSGYLMAYPETFFDRLERGEWVWAPYYTLHKILAGLIDQYIYCNNQMALELASKMAEWISERNSGFTEDEMQSILDMEHGGMTEALTDLFLLTGNPEHLELAKRFEHKRIIEPLALNMDPLLGEHINTQLPKILGAARMYEQSKDEYYQKVSLNGWDRIYNGRLYSFGGFSNYEHFLRPQYFLADQLSVESAESCCTHNMLKLADRLFTWNPDVKYAEYYEKAIVNHILASQDPENGMFMYYIPLKAGHWKIFSTPDSSFWCCVGSGMENHSQYGRSVYYHTDEDLYISQYIASELNWKEKGVTISQETGFPEEEGSTVKVRLKKARQFTIKLRVPAWAYNEFSVSVNGKIIKERFLPSSWVSISREWNDNDIIEIEFPYSLHIERLPDDPAVFSILNGPLVLAADLGYDNLNDKMRYLHDQRGMHKGPSIDVPALEINNKELSEWLIADDGIHSVFTTFEAGVPEDFRLIPFYKLHKQRYMIYFNQTDYEPLKKPWDFD